MDSDSKGDGKEPGIGKKVPRWRHKEGKQMMGAYRERKDYEKEVFVNRLSSMHRRMNVGVDEIVYSEINGKEMVGILYDQRMKHTPTELDVTGLSLMRIYMEVHKLLFGEKRDKGGEW